MSDVDADRGKGDGGQEISGKFVVACGDPAQMLEFVEEALDQVALAIAFEVDGAYHPDVALAGDVGGGSARGEEFDDAAGAVAAVGDRVAGGPQSGDEAGQGGFVRGLAGRQQQTHRQTDGIDDGVDLGAQSSTRTANGVILAPFMEWPAPLLQHVRVGEWRMSQWTLVFSGSTWARTAAAWSD